MWPEVIKLQFDESREIATVVSSLFAIDTPSGGGLGKMIGSLEIWVYGEDVAIHLVAGT